MPGSFVAEISVNMNDTPNLALPYILASQAQKHVTHNEAIRTLDCLVQLAVESRGLPRLHRHRLMAPVLWSPPLQPETGTARVGRSLSFV